MELDMNTQGYALHHTFHTRRICPLLYNKTYNLKVFQINKSNSKY